MSSAKDTTATVIPCLRYEDAPKALDWLCRAFGFEKHLVVPGEGDTIVHAELTAGRGMVMLGSAREHGGGYDELMATPRELGGRGTQSTYVIVDDADAHFAQARAAGAEIMLDLEDQDHGGRMYTCRDPEGHVWSFGTFDPWIQD
ncbi:MAG: VOC family protein [Proteobacteria bacterium]|nr:VOC family protein [Pseudomonadota bacterium]